MPTYAKHNYTVADACGSIAFGHGHIVVFEAFNQLQPPSFVTQGFSCGHD